MSNELASVAPRERCVVRYALERHAAERPDAIFAVSDDGRRWTFAETLRRVEEAATGLQALGVAQGDPVLLLLPNTLDAVCCLFAVNHLGAICVPVNPAYKGRLLEHVVHNSGARLAIVHPDVVAELVSIERSELTTVVVLGTSALPAGLDRLQVLGAESLKADRASLRPLQRPIEPWDTQSIIYTSGTTGPSKGVLSSYMHSYAATGPHAWCHLRDDDRHLIHMPLFHIGGAFICYMAACRGASIAVVRGFRTDVFWRTVDELGVTVVFLLGAMASFLLKQAPQADDRAHGLRMVFIVPLGGLSPPFRERFGVDVCTIFNMTEISTPLRSELNPEKPNCCGRPRPGVTVRLVDENDCEVLRGEPGELVIRTEQPWAMNHGYNANPEATVQAWRNGWFHTGDVFVTDEEGDFYFVDRRKDMIRRRGENISAYELESELFRHPAIREAAAIGVPSRFGEDDVMVVLALQPGQSLEPEVLLDFLSDRVPHFMLPRYVRTMPALPLTETAKIRKQLLREQGVTADTWDRERAGVRVRAQRFD